MSVAFRYICLLFGCFLFLGIKKGLGQDSCVNCNYDSLYNTLADKKTDREKANHLILLIDLRPADSATVKLIDQLILMENRIRGIDPAPYKLLKDVHLFTRNKEYSKALDAIKKVIDLLDKKNKTVMHYLEYSRNFFVDLNLSEEGYTYYKQKLDYYRVHNHPANIAGCFFCLAGHYSRKADVNQSISHYLKSAEIYKNLYPYKYLNVLGVIGSAYSNWGNTKKSLYYFELAEKVATKLDTVLGPLTLLGMADLYFQRKNYTKALDYLDELLFIRKPHPTATANALTRKANILLEMNKPELVFPLLQRAKQLSDSLKSRLRSRAGNLEIDYVMYRYFSVSGNRSLAEKYLIDAYAKTSDEEVLGLELKYLKELSLFYAIQNPPLAKKYLEKYYALNDTIKSQQGEFLIANFENEQKENELNTKINDLKKDQEIQAFKLQQRNTLLWGGAGVVLLIAALTIFLFMQLKAKKKTLASLHQAQKQLILSEKMASLGELTAGIAHEIQNPLNFINNFSEVNAELISEMEEEIDAKNFEAVKPLAKDVRENEDKIIFHGRRADGIIKNMLQHSRTGAGKKESTDINALAEEYIRLAYHGIRAKDSAFNVNVDTQFDPQAGKLDMVPQDIGRVLLNLLNNAFHAVAEKSKLENNGYHPSVP